jgi:hypothetical protein
MPTLNHGIPATSRRTPRPLTPSDAGVPAAVVTMLCLVVTALCYFGLTLVDRAVHHALAGPHTVPVTRALVAIVAGLATAAGLHGYKYTTERKHVK